jgi:hypothetical protein
VRVPSAAQTPQGTDTLLALAMGHAGKLHFGLIWSGKRYPSQLMSPLHALASAFAFAFACVSPACFNHAHGLDASVLWWLQGPNEAPIT